MYLLKQVSELQANFVDLERRINSIIEDLIGSQAEAIDKEPTEVPSGIISRLSYDISRMNDRTRKVCNKLDNLRDSLGLTEPASDNPGIAYAKGAY